MTTKSQTTPEVIVAEPTTEGVSNALLESPEAKFVVAAILVNKEFNANEGHPERKGAHVVYSGFNEEFTKRFDKPSREITDALAEAGVIAVRPARGGPVLYMPQDAPAQKASAKQAMSKIVVA